MRAQVRILISDLRYRSAYFARIFPILAMLAYGFQSRLFKFKKTWRSMKGSEENGRETICALPWVHTFTNELGNTFPCCISTGDGLPNADRLGRAYKVFEPGQLEKSWNSDDMKGLRREMMANRRPLSCERCYKFEDLGIQSHRQGANHRWEAQLKKALAQTSEDGSAPMRFYSADIRLGNQCNLRCRMCSPISSKGLASDWTQMGKMSSKVADSFLSLSWFEKDEFWNMFLKYSEDLESLHFAGGEPFIIKQHFVFLKNLVGRGVSKNLTLSYNTNLTVLPPELLELWQHFKAVDLMVSLDGMEEVNHYIRFPSNWNKIQSNIKYLHENLEKYHIRNLNFNLTVQIYNIFNLPELIDFLISEYPKAAYSTLSLLFSPAELSIQVLPSEFKSKLTESWTSYLEARKVSWAKRGEGCYEADGFVKNIEGVLQFMNKEDYSNLLPSFKKRTRAFDLHRKQSCAVVIPELAPLFDQAGGATETLQLYTHQ